MTSIGKIMLMLTRFRMVVGTLVSLGNAENFKLKLASYEHTENNIASNTDNAEEKIEQGLDPIGRGMTYRAVPIDESYPEYIQNNQEKYSEFIKPWN